jgi:hypothetical protein
MAVRGRTIYYCAWNKGLKMLNLSDRFVSDIISSDMSYVEYVATSEDNLYYTNVVLLFSYCPLVTSNRKAVLLSLATNNLLVDLS